MENAEQKNLQDAINDLFDCYDGPERIKEFLWEQLTTAMGSSRSDEWSGRERIDILNFYHFMGKVVEAAHPLYKKKKVDAGD